MEHSAESLGDVGSQQKVAVKHRQGAAPNSHFGEGSANLNWDAAIAAHNHRVLVSLMAIGIPIDRAQDLTNQTWMRLVEQHRAGKLREIKLPGLAIAQARYLALNAIENTETKRKRSVPLDDLLNPPQTTEPNVESRLLDREKLKQALGALEGLSKTARTVFCYAYEDPPPSHKVIAQRVGLSVQRVRQILCEVRQSMRDAMEDDQ